MNITIEEAVMKVGIQSLEIERLIKENAMLTKRIKDLERAMIPIKEEWKRFKADEYKSRGEESKIPLLESM